METRAKYNFHACNKNRLPSTKQSITLKFGFIDRINRGGKGKQELGSTWLNQCNQTSPTVPASKPTVPEKQNSRYAPVLFVIISSTSTLVCSNVLLFCCESQPFLARIRGTKKRGPFAHNEARELQRKQPPGGGGVQWRHSRNPRNGPKGKS